MKIKLDNNLDYFKLIRNASGKSQKIQHLVKKKVKKITKFTSNLLLSCTSTLMYVHHVQYTLNTYFKCVWCVQCRNTTYNVRPTCTCTSSTPHVYNKRLMYTFSMDFWSIFCLPSIPSIGFARHIFGRLRHPPILSVQ